MRPIDPGILRIRRRRVCHFSWCQVYSPRRRFFPGRKVTGLSPIRNPMAGLKSGSFPLTAAVVAFAVLAIASVLGLARRIVWATMCPQKAEPILVEHVCMNVNNLHELLLVLLSGIWSLRK